ncbi:MAG: chemotaxis response regulator protein-glutamate methylesterase [Fibrobacter sp.]|nr:chemotaxis response regulator protein-glutamate methylesterase [Fibrobacter sp.]
MFKPIKVLVVDDSAVVREVLSTELNKQKGIEVVATAPDPYVARTKIVQHNPDVMTLDIEMPRMDGLTFLRKVMRHKPIPTIIISSLTPAGGDMALEALDAGALDVLCKPGASYLVGDIIGILSEQIRAVAHIKLEAIVKDHQVNPSVIKRPRSLRTTRKILALGASTGGVQAVEHIIRQMPPDAPPILIAQHMPESFTKSFAKRLNQIAQIEVREARHGDSVLPGTALLAPGNWHMRLKRSGAVYLVELDQEERVHFQRPAVDILFESLATWGGANVVAAVLTGMGKDGAEGLFKIRQAGGRTIGQDEATSIVYGMPGAAYKLGGVEIQLPLNKIAAHALDLIKQSSP